MPKTHFRLHQIGSLVLRLGLFARMSGYAAESAAGPMPAILIGAIRWAVNLAAKIR
jgi:hypothetical protein